MPIIVERGAKQEYVDTEDGRRYFSVSQVRQVVHNPTIGIPSDVLEQARQRGAILHQRFWRLLASKVKLVEHPQIVPGLEGYCAAMDTWALEHLVEPISLEEIVVSKTHGYAGQKDATIYYGKAGWRVLVDLKTGQPTVTDTMQLLAYNEASSTRLSRMMDLYIFANGSYHEKWVTMQDKIKHFPPFLNAISLLRWRLANT
jgi:hypothetical protein